MNGPNHIAGGLAFTGIFASFFDINVFENSAFLITTITASLLPDIDHTKSYIGKTFYPISKLIDKKYGHRTITHSIFFLFGITMFCGFLEFSFLNQRTFTIIVFFGILSHLILDMVTVQGIPLFYPFYRNPCVIPANPSSRIRNKNIKAQAMAFFFFAFILFTCQDLFANGFWTSYNRAFGTIKHVWAESKKTTNKVYVDYSFTRNGQEKEGKAELINANQNELILFDNKIFTIKSTDIIKHTKPIKSIEKPIINETSFFSISIDSLNKILENQIVNGTIQSNKKFLININNIQKQTQKHTFKNEYNTYLTIGIDTLIDNTENQIKELEIKSKNLKNKTAEHNNKLRKLQKKRKILNEKMNISNNIYNENKISEEIILITKKIEAFKREDSNTELLDFKIKILKEQIKKNDNQVFSGIVTLRRVQK